MFEELLKNYNMQDYPRCFTEFIHLFLLLLYFLNCLKLDKNNNWKHHILSFQVMDIYSLMESIANIIPNI